MKVPLSLLQEYLSFKESPEELAKILTLAGIEVDAIEGDVLEVSLTPNLGHCMSLYGFARELSALLDVPLKKPAFELKEGEPAEIKVHLIDKRQCLRYACRVVRGIRVGPSPQWLKERVEVCGLRSINNVVDVGNWVMLSLGQPLHMFDYDRISGHEIFVRSETDYKQLFTLDEVERTIPPEALLICDREKPLAFAGVMGGKSSAVTEETMNVLIEAAYFTPQAVRKASRLLGLKSDSSQRFEKGIDPQAVVWSLNYAAHLLQKVAGGDIARGVIDEKAHEFREKKIACRMERTNRLLGLHLSAGEIAGLLGRLGMEILEENTHQLLVAVPTYRNDVSIEDDLIEEVARLYGYNHFPKVTPVHISSTIPHAPLYLMEKETREHLIGEGLQEFVTCDLISPTQVAMTRENILGDEAVIAVLQSHSVEQSVLRTTLLPGLLQVVKYNFDHGNPDIAGLEVGRVHFKQDGGYLEPSTAGIILSGKRGPYHFDPKPQDVDFFDLKGIIENLLAGFKIEELAFEVSHLHNFHPGRQAKVKKGDVYLGVIGEVHPDHVAKIDIPQRVYFAEINLHEVMNLQPKAWQVKEWGQFPGSQRDWTVMLNAEVPVEAILSTLRAGASPLLEKVILLDLYKSEQIGKDKKNATFRFFYRDKEKTVDFETVEREHARLIKAAAETLNRGHL